MGVSGLIVMKNNTTVKKTGDLFTYDKVGRIVKVDLLDREHEERSVRSYLNELKEIRHYKEKYEKLIKRGAMACAIDRNGIITYASRVLEQSTFTYLQDLPEEMNTDRYRKKPFYKLVNGEIEIDEAQHKKYKYGGLL